MLEFAKFCNAGRSLRWRQRSRRSRHLLQWAISLQQQQPRRLFARTAEVAATAHCDQQSAGADIRYRHMNTLK